MKCNKGENMTAFDFCTCDNFNCVHHPINTDGSCTACVAKNLRNNEIPSCFFNKADGIKKRAKYKFEDFAEVIMNKNK